MKLHIFGIAALVMLTACNKDKATVNGRFAGTGESMLYLERIMPGKTPAIDSTKSDSKGNFRFKITLEKGEPAFYTLRAGGDAVTLLVSPGEKIRLNSMGAISHNYTVMGSDGSEQLRVLNQSFAAGGAQLDSILNLYASAEGDRRQELSKEYTSLYYRIKRDHIKFIVENSRSLAGLYALYQRLPHEANLATGEGDIVYYNMIADSVAIDHPDSPYLKALRNEIASNARGEDLSRYINERLRADAEGFPELNLPDMYGNRRSLSSLTGKIILLDFWASASAEARLNNAEYKRLYDRYSERGFEIYQVSVDQSKADWVNAVQQQKLPWITVCDFQGGGGIGPLAYNVTRVPANYLIDAEGNIVGKDIFGDELTNRISQLLRK